MGVIQGMDDVMEMVAPGTDLRIALDMILSADNTHPIGRPCDQLSRYRWRLDQWPPPQPFFSSSRRWTACSMRPLGASWGSVHLSPTMEKRKKKSHRHAHRADRHLAITVSLSDATSSISTLGESKTLALKSFSRSTV